MRTAVATFGFGRPDHFSRMLASLGACPEVQSKNVDVFHFLDGGEGSQQDELTEVIVESGLPYVKIIARNENFGVGRQLISARREIFDEHGYDRMILVEDDIELNATFLTTLLRLADWATQYNDIGTVQVWNVEHGSREEFQQHLDEIELTNRHFVSYCMFKSTWDAIKETLYKYEQTYLLKKPYRNRPHYRIRAFMRRSLKQGRKTPPSPRLDPPVEAIHNPFPTVSWRWAPTSQDAITSLAMYLAGLHRVTTRVPHAFYFGVTGVHCTPELYEQMGFNDQGYWQWQADDVPTTFTIRYQDEQGAWLKSSYR
jgi:hypothetical protein